MHGRHQEEFTTAAAATRKETSSVATFTKKETRTLDECLQLLLTIRNQHDDHLTGEGEAPLIMLLNQFLRMNPPLLELSPPPSLPHHPSPPLYQSPSFWNNYQVTESLSSLPVTIAAAESSVSGTGNATSATTHRSNATTNATILRDVSEEQPTLIDNVTISNHSESIQKFVVEWCLEHDSNNNNDTTFTLSAANRKSVFDKEQRNKPLLSEIDDISSLIEYVWQTTQPVLIILKRQLHEGKVQLRSQLWTAILPPNRPFGSTLHILVLTYGLLYYLQVHWICMPLCFFTSTATTKEDDAVYLYSIVEVQLNVLITLLVTIFYLGYETCRHHILQVQEKRTQSTMLNMDDNTSVRSTRQSNHSRSNLRRPSIILQSQSSASLASLATSASQNNICTKQGNGKGRKRLLASRNNMSTYENSRYGTPTSHSQRAGNMKRHESYDSLNSYSDSSLRDGVLPSPLPMFTATAKTNHSCWLEPPAQLFRVRGTTYLQDRIKVLSGPPLFQCIGVDVWLCGANNPMRHIIRHPSVLGGRLQDRMKRKNIETTTTNDNSHLDNNHENDVLVVNFLLPFGNLVAYFESSSSQTHQNKILNYHACDTASAPNEKPPRSGAHSNNNDNERIFPESTLTKKLKAAPSSVKNLWDQFKNGSKEYRDARLKMLPIVMEGPWIVRKAVGPGNAPALLGKVVPLEYYFTKFDDGVDNDRNDEERLVSEIDCNKEENQIKTTANSNTEHHDENMNNSYLPTISALNAATGESSSADGGSSGSGSNAVRKRNNCGGIYEVDVIINASKVATGILNVVKGHAKNFSIAFGFILEGSTQNELPENILCSFQMHNLHIEKCPTLPYWKVET